MSSHPPALIQARQHFQAGRLEQARMLVQRFLQREPTHAEANHSMAAILFQSGQRPQALFYAERAAAAAPATADYQSTLANILHAMERTSEAIAAMQKACDLDPHNADHPLNLLPMAWSAGNHAKALAAAERALAIDRVRARGSYATVLANIGEVDAAVTFLRGELERDPGDLEVLSALILALNYQPDTDPREVFELHRRFGAAIQPAPFARSPANAKDPHRRIRVGLISPDFYSHSVAFFAEPLIRHLDRAAFEVFCYSSRAFPDDTTRRLQSLADTWRDIAGIDEPAIATHISSDRIDILIDLAGLTTGRVVSVLAARPAPVQVTAIGYPNTTGIPAVGYRLVDAVTDPPESLATEQLIRLSGCFLCYQPPANAPAPTPEPPCTKTGHITFGSFNTAQKIVPPVIHAWARIVNQVPGSRLLLKAAQFLCPMVRSSFTAKFAAAGLDPTRLELLATVRDKSSHLSIYDRIDVGLDTFPYNGTTTTCEALHMGVPVVTVQGAMHPGRVGASLLTAIDLPDLIAPDVEQFIQQAAELAKDPARLADLRRGMRSRMLSSTLCDGPDYARRVGEALRSIWQAHCAKP